MDTFAMKYINKKTFNPIRRTLGNRNGRIVITTAIIALVVICIFFSGYNAEVNINGTEIQIKLDAGGK